MLASRRIVVAAVAAAAAIGAAVLIGVAVSGGDGAGPAAVPTHRVVQPGAPGQSARTLSPRTSPGCPRRPTTRPTSRS
ncbi:hypothetical protein ACFQY4_24790 [Catellatospora bangladeshensis]|uniref:hypothetical protein n=1 Tax=Catellatospora bangladeshensis TaxID=310355 RepID=UPI00361836B5